MTSVDQTLSIIRKMHAQHVKMAQIKKRNKELAEDIRKAPKDRKKEFWENEYNINQYTDASKYAKKYYGEVMSETTKYDNDWD